MGQLARSWCSHATCVGNKLVNSSEVGTQAVKWGNLMVWLSITRYLSQVPLWLPEPTLTFTSPCSFHPIFLLVFTVRLRSHLFCLSFSHGQEGVKSVVC